MSHPPGLSVNEHIDDSVASVRYSDFDNAVSMIKTLGTGALIGKMDIKSAFRLLPCYPGDFDLLGFKFDNFYFIDKMAPMGLKLSCRCWESLASFLNWLTKKRAGSENIDHYLDDFFFAGPPHSSHCSELMLEFSKLCQELMIPIAQEKTEGPTTCMTYLGYQLDTIRLQISIPKVKVENLLSLIDAALPLKKITLKNLQSLTGSLQFCAKAMPSARAFIRRMYAAMSQASQPFHRVRLSKGIKSDLMMWKEFLTNFNGTTYMLEVDGVTSADLQLQTDSAGGVALGCGIYFRGAWCYLKWPESWQESDILRDITFLELVPIALAVCLWKHKFVGMRIQFCCDNMAVVHILNSKSAKSDRVMSLVRQIVLWSLTFDFHITGLFVPGSQNTLCDLISRMQFNKFKSLAPEAEQEPTKIPEGFLDLLPVK